MNKMIVFLFGLLSVTGSAFAQQSVTAGNVTVKGVIGGQIISLSTTDFPTERDFKTTMVTVKKGDTCMKLTRLSYKECEELGRKYGRDPLVFISPDFKHTYIVPLYAGEEIAYVVYKDGKKEWKLYKN